MMATENWNVYQHKSQVSGKQVWKSGVRTATRSVPILAPDF